MNLGNLFLSFVDLRDVSYPESFQFKERTGKAKGDEINPGSNKFMVRLKITLSGKRSPFSELVHRTLRILSRKP